MEIANHASGSIEVMIESSSHRGSIADCLVAWMPVQTLIMRSCAAIVHVELEMYRNS
jgi:hypothetical protein